MKGALRDVCRIKNGTGNHTKQLDPWQIESRHSAARGGRAGTHENVESCQDNRGSPSHDRKLLGLAVTSLCAESRSRLGTTRGIPRVLVT